MGKTNAAFCGTGSNTARNTNDSRLEIQFWHSRYSPDIQLSQKEMCKISQEIRQEFAPKVESSASELVILPVDPYHLYAYWNLSEINTGTATKTDSGLNLVLRIYWRTDERHDTSETKLWFDVPLEGNQSQRKVRLPMDETDYSAAIGRRFSDRSFHLMAYSNIIHIPRGRMAPSKPSKEMRRFAAIPKAIIPKRKPLDWGADENYDESLIDSKIKKTLYEKGIENNVDILLHTGKITSPKAHYLSKSFSGKGIDF